MTIAYKKFGAAGVSLWLDHLDRKRITSGTLKRLIEDGSIVGVTTNPTIFARAITAGSGYEDQIHDLAIRGVGIDESLRLLMAHDVRSACDLLRPVYQSTDERDGRVSIEVDPRISRDADRTAAEARGLWWLVDRPNLFIKIPATEAALPAITATIASGISVNATLIFSIDRYRAVVDAFMTGLEQRASRGESLAHIESVASFFISRVDSEVDKRLADRAVNSEAARFRGQAAIANARLAYEVFESYAASERWRALAVKGASPQRLLWASTGVKDAAFPATRYVTELVAPNTVNTMPEATLTALKAWASAVSNSISNRYSEARVTVRQLSDLGIDLEEVAKSLERDGLNAFAASWSDLTSSVERQLAAARP